MSGCRRCGSVTELFNVRSENWCSKCLVRFIDKTIWKKLEAYDKLLQPSPEQLDIVIVASEAANTQILTRHLYQRHVLHRINKKRHAARLTVAFVAPTRSKSLQAFANQLTNEFPLVQTRIVALQDQLEASSSFFCLLDKSAFRAQNTGARCQAMLIGPSCSDIFYSLKLKVVTLLVQNANFVFWTDDATDMAAQILTSVSNGRGFTVSQECSVQSKWAKSFSVHPLADVLKQELQLYYSLQSDQTDIVIKTNLVAKGSIRDHAETYFGSLEISYPSLVYTVVKTIGKVKHLQPENFQETCLFCGMYLNDSKSQSILDALVQICYGCRVALQGITGLFPWIEALK